MSLKNEYVFNKMVPFSLLIPLISGISAFFLLEVFVHPGFVEKFLTFISVGFENRLFYLPFVRWLAYLDLSVPNRDM